MTAAERNRSQARGSRHRRPAKRRRRCTWSSRSRFWSSLQCGEQVDSSRDSCRAAPRAEHPKARQTEQPRHRRRPREAPTCAARVAVAAWRRLPVGRRWSRARARRAAGGCAHRARSRRVESAAASRAAGTRSRIHRGRARSLRHRCAADEHAAARGDANVAQVSPGAARRKHHGRHLGSQLVVPMQRSQLRMNVGAGISRTARRAALAPRAAYPTDVAPGLARRPARRRRRLARRAWRCLGPAPCLGRPTQRTSAMQGEGQRAVRDIPASLVERRQRRFDTAASRTPTRARADYRLHRSSRGLARRALRGLAAGNRERQRLDLECGEGVIRGRRRCRCVSAWSTAGAAASAAVARAGRRAAAETAFATQRPRDAGPPRYRRLQPPNGPQRARAPVRSGGGFRQDRARARRLGVGAWSLGRESAR